MSEVLEELWTYDDVQLYVRQLAAEHGLTDQITESVVLRCATLAQNTLDISLFMVFEHSDPETAAVLDFTGDIRILISTYLNSLFATLKHHKDLRGYEHVKTDG